MLLQCTDRFIKIMTTWPSDKANHSCDNNLFTVVQDQLEGSFDSISTKYGI